MDSDQDERITERTSSEDMEPADNSHSLPEPQPDTNSKNMTGVGIAIGAGLGVALGLVFDNLALGIGIGVAIGVAIGAGMSQRRSSSSDDLPGRRNSPMIAILIGGLVLLLGIVLIVYLLVRQ